MNIYENILYQNDIEFVAKLNLPWEKLNGKPIFISGATGMIGSFLIDVLLYKRNQGVDCKIFAIGRNEEKARLRFPYCMDDEAFVFLKWDVNDPMKMKNAEKSGYVLHLASNTHPVAYATDPIGTISTNIIGLKNMLDFAVSFGAERFVFASSNEIYGENRGDVEKFDEAYCGYMDCNTMRAGYPESKRCGEALCQAYKAQKGLDIVIPRLTRTYGPTLLDSDTKALSQFLHKALAGEDIVLKSEGNQFYSYTYVADAVSGLLTVMLCGMNGEAYNISDEQTDIKLKDLAELVANFCGKKVVFELPDKNERAGYSTATKARLDSRKLQALGWQAKYPISAGIERTINIMKE